MVDGALAAFHDVCGRISAECPAGAPTTESLCGPVVLPRWLSRDRRASAGAVGAASAAGSSCAEIPRRTPEAGAAAVGVAVATAALVSDAAPLDEDTGATSGGGDDERRLPPRPPATPPPPSTVRLTPVASGGVPEPPADSAVEQRRDVGVNEVTEQVEEAEEGGREGGEREPTDPDASRMDNSGDGAGNVESPRPEGGSHQEAEVPARQHPIGAADGTALSSGEGIQQRLFRHNQQPTTRPSDGCEDHPQRSNQSVPPAAGEELEGNGAVEAGAGTSPASEPATVAAVVVGDCFTYSDDEDDSLAATPGGKEAAHNSASLPPERGPASPSPFPPPLLVLGVGDATASPGDLADGGGDDAASDEADEEAAAGRDGQPRRRPRGPFGESSAAATGSREKEGGGDEEKNASGDGVAGTGGGGKHHQVGAPVVDGGGADGGRRCLVKDSRAAEGEKRGNESSRRACSRERAGKAGAIAAAEARTGREREQRHDNSNSSSNNYNLDGAGRERTGSADLLAQAYVADSSPTREASSDPRGGEQACVDGLLRRSLAGSVASSWDASPLRGESISVSAIASTAAADPAAAAAAAARDGSSAGSHDGGDCDDDGGGGGGGGGDDSGGERDDDATGVDLLAAAKAALGREGVSFAAGGGDVVGGALSKWLGEEGEGRRSVPHREEAAEKAVAGRETASSSSSSSSADIDRRASRRRGGESERFNAKNSPTRRHRPPSPDDDPARVAGAPQGDHRRHPGGGEEDGRSGGRAASIADWTTKELEEELCRVREAIESRVRVSCNKRVPEPQWRGGGDGCSM